MISRSMRRCSSALGGGGGALVCVGARVGAVATVGAGVASADRRGAGAGTGKGAAAIGLSTWAISSPSASRTLCAARWSALSFSRISASSGSASCVGYRSRTRRWR
jgi:hypothetical protein